MRLLPRNLNAIYSAMWGVGGGAFVSFFVVGWLGGIWPIVNGVGSVGVRVAIGVGMGVAVSRLVSQWGTTNTRVAIGVGFIIGAFVGGAAGLVVVGIVFGIIVGGLICHEIHRTYEP